LRFTERLVRLRVGLSYAAGLAALALAEPSAGSLALGIPLAGVGEALRIWAAGHLVKGGPGLTRSGPYRWTRNPLYLGSFLIGWGFAVAAASWLVLALVLLLFLGIYLPVLREESRRLAAQHPQAYAEFAGQVPLFWPTRRPRFGPIPGRFSWRRAVANKEHWTIAGWLFGVLLLCWKAA
jgi:protein-S-isoprenylcysteine O-methyltransferase Ste14